ncbi:HAD-IIA family hydrolase [Trueperella bialowiezensis]|uniref:UMP phosphatase n=1 Tax=Trueperella bialowiezensis TaxID=312285 RepID=A0A448PFH4_9ACTO|nr:HAD hydrolase-like protein [Trueperella bialowiezensis]VEI13666.1 UMP phosphatase [Trueperella bialowiezensis]
MRFQMPEIPKINPKALIPDEVRERFARKTAEKADEAATERVSTAPGTDVGEKEISQRIADLDVMVQEPPQRVFDAYLLNIDATLYAGTQLMPEMKTVIDVLDELRRPVRYLSMMSTVSTDALIEAMAKEGVAIEPHQIVTPGRQLSNYLHKSYPGANVFVIGDDTLSAELSSAGIKLCDDPAKINVVLVAHDRNFTFDKLATAFRAIDENGAELVASSLRRVRRQPDGTREPGTLSIVTAIEVATRKRVVKNLGAPETDLLEMIFEDLAAEPQDALLVTDSLGADIRMAKRFGIPTALILAGDVTIDDARNRQEKDQPNYVLDSLDSIVPPYIKDQL